MDWGIRPDRGTEGGSNPTGGEYTETITGRVMEGMTFSTFGGGGGAGMFSALEWIMKGACVGDAGALCGARVPDGAAELLEGEPEFVAAVSGNFTKKEQLTW